MIESISFSGGSWIGLCYYLGCLSYLITVVPDDIITLGSSAGAWAATALHIRHIIDIKSIKKKVYRLMDMVGYYPVQCEKYLADFFDEVFVFDVSKIDGFKNRLHISISHVEKTKLKNEMVLNFHDKAKLKKTLIDSSRLPFIIGSGKVIDGGLTSNQPVLNGKTLKINCITGLFGAHIFPSKWINPLYVVFPPPFKMREKIYMMGFNDTKKYIITHKCFKKNI